MRSGSSPDASQPSRRWLGTVAATRSRAAERLSQQPLCSRAGAGCPSEELVMADPEPLPGLGKGSSFLGLVAGPVAGSQVVHGSCASC